MKKNIALSSWLVIGMLIISFLMSSCKPYRKVIPTDALVVVEVDIKELGKKSDFLDQRDDFARLIASVDSGNHILNKLANSVKEPHQSGLRTQPMYFFIPSTGKEVFLTAAVRRRNKVIKTFESFSKDVRIEDDDNISWIFVKDNLIGAITRKTLLLGSAHTKDEYYNLLTQKQGYFETDAGKLMERHRGDITAMINLKNLPREAREEVEFAMDLLRYQTGDAVNKTLKQVLDAQIIMNVKFESGHIALNAIAHGLKDDSINKLFNKKIQSNDLKAVPNHNLLGVIATTINGKECWKISKDLIPLLIGDLSNTGNIELEPIGEYIRALDGTMIASIAMKDLMEEPKALCILPIDASKVERAISDYQFELPHDIYIGGDQQHFVITNSPEYQFGTQKTAFTKASNATSCYMYAYLNAQHIMNVVLPIIPESTLNTSMRNSLKILDFVELKMTQANEASLCIYLKDNSKNSLAILLEQLIKNL